MANENQGFAVNNALLQEFLQESMEMLDSLDQLFVSLEQKPDDLGIINQIFRPVHSIKGNSAFFNLTNVKNFSHTLENLLQEIRNGKRRATAEITNALLKGIDFLRQMLERFVNGEMSTELKPEEKAHLEVLTGISQSGEATVESLARAVREALNAISDKDIPSAIAEKYKALATASAHLVDVVAPEAKTAISNKNGKAGGSVYKINGKDMSAAVNTVITTINGMVELSKDAKNLDAFAAALKEIINAAGQNAPLQEAILKIEDEFSTVRNAGIAFDDLLAGLLKEHLEEAMHHVEICGGAAPAPGAKQVYKINGKEMTAAVNTMVTTINGMVELSKDEKNLDAFAAALKEILGAAKGSPLEEAILKIEDEFQTIRGAGIGFDALVTSLLQDHLKEAMPQIETVAEAPAAAPAPAAAAPAPAAAPAADKKNAQAAGAHKIQKTLRVPEDTIDVFISYVSELIITGEVFHYLQKHLEQVDDRAKIIREFKTANIAFSNLSLNLQKSIMAIRRVELRQVFQKLPRIVHDTAGQLGKKIDFTIVGEDLQIDKALVENLEAPLIHMVRNSADHGIETPEERKAAGKPETGKVSLVAEIVEDKCILKLKDDGHGLNVDAIKKKSIANGIITEERAASMSDSEACRLIFAAGVSTAKKITDVSGRGVGMDVVLSNITAMNGTIDIASTYGKGSEMTITLPMSLTTLVIEGVLARVGNEQYIVPLTDIRNLIRPNEKQFSSVSERGQMLMVRDELYRILRLDQFLNVQGSHTDNLEHSTIILVESEVGTCALVVDEILGQQSVVLKNLDEQFKNLKFLRGTAILGDGHVGLVLDIKNLIDFAFNNAV